jgi:transposase-like protein
MKKKSPGTRYSDETQKRIVEDKITNGLGLRETARKYSVQPTSLRAWESKWGNLFQPNSRSRKLKEDEWTAARRVEIVAKTLSMSKAELSEFLQAKGLKPETLEKWRTDLLMANHFSSAYVEEPKKVVSNVTPTPSIHNSSDSNEQLRRENEALRLRVKQLESYIDDLSDQLRSMSRLVGLKSSNSAFDI